MSKTALVIGAKDILSAAELIDFIHEVGFLPLLPNKIEGFSAEEVVDETCRYQPSSEGGFDWPLWMWKGDIIEEGNCVYGKFFHGTAGFISLEWWKDFVNYRRSTLLPHKKRDPIIEEAILSTLEAEGSMVSTDLRTACGFNGGKQRSQFDAYITRLQVATRIVTENFVWSVDKHGRNYGWGKSLLTTPERLLGRAACAQPTDADGHPRKPEASYRLIMEHLQSILPDATESQIHYMIHK